MTKKILNTVEEVCLFADNAVKPVPTFLTYFSRKNVSKKIENKTFSC